MAPICLPVTKIHNFQSHSLKKLQTSLKTTHPFTLPYYVH